jgi:hypothetical protein
MNCSTNMSPVLRPNYLSKFNSFLSEVMKVKLTPTDYEDLPKIREFTGTTIKLKAMLDTIQPHLGQEKTLKLMEVLPFFDNSPNDLKAFILLALGIRSTNLTAKT